MTISLTTPINFENQRGIRRDDNAKTPSFFCTADNVSVDTTLLRGLKVFSSDHNCDVRLCLHQTPEAPFHDMIILQRKDGGFRRPHCHATKGETWHLLDGEMLAIVFDSAGEVKDAGVLEPKKSFLFRVKEGMFHTTLPLTETVIFHESKPGPFLGDGDSIYPDWAPDGSDVNSSSTYQQELLRSFGK